MTSLRFCGAMKASTSLEAIIGDARPVWWRAFKKSVRRAELRRQQAALAKAIEENEQSELDL